MPKDRPRPGGTEFHIGTLVSNRTKEGLVEVILGDEKVQMPPAQAREIGAWFIGAAEAAETDAFIVEFMRKTVGVDDAMAVNILVHLREYRLRSANLPGTSHSTTLYREN